MRRMIPLLLISVMASMPQVGGAEDPPLSGYSPSAADAERAWGYSGSRPFARIHASHQRPPHHVGSPYDKAYASHCTSFAHCGTTTLAGTLFENFTPWAFRGGFAPGFSYKQSFLPL